MKHRNYNYRPIYHLSILSQFSKKLEKLIKRLINFDEKYNLLSNCHFVFWTNNSTSYNWYNSQLTWFGFRNIRT